MASNKKRPSIFDIINNVGTEYIIKDNKGSILKTKEQKKEHFKRIGQIKVVKKGGKIKTYKKGGKAK